MLNVKKCMCWYSSIIELKNARCNIVKKKKQIHVLAVGSKTSATDDILDLGIPWELTHTHIMYYLQKFNNISIIIRTYEATQQSILTHNTVTHHKNFIYPILHNTTPHT